MAHFRERRCPRRAGIIHFRQAASAVAILSVLTTASLCAQETESQPDRDHAPFVLHVYANLMQFPTIVLGTDLKPILPVSRQKFAVTLDGGPIFHPTQMRVEGNDPIALAVLIDASGAQDKLVHNFADAFSQLAPAFLHPNDRITVYAQDCHFVRSLHDQPPDRERLRLSLERVLQAESLHGAKPRPTCSDSLNLWDTLSVVTEDLSLQPGRRVILAVTLGKESKSQTSFATLANYVGRNGTAVFRLRDRTLTSDGPTQRFYSSGRLGSPRPTYAEDMFAELCEVSGGMDLEAPSRGLVKQLQDFITILRNRYILEFPRPDDATPTHHQIDVSIPGTLAFIRSTGGSSPLPDPALLNDPNTLRSAPSPAVTGKRHALEPDTKH